MSAAPKRQRGIALLLLVAALAMGATWYIVSRVRQLSLNNIAADRAYNAQVLNRAKQALIGYVVAQANKAFEDNPGALPCPEAPGSFNQTNGTDGKVDTTGCTAASVPAVGRYPWRTIGTEQLKDAAGESLWYVVSPGWAITGVGTNTLINSNSLGQLNVDNVAPASQAAGDTVIALIIAPGPAINVPASSGCAAWSQSRPATAGAAPDWRNYLECENATNPADVKFVTSGPSGAFNDQVLKITVSDLMPGLEASIANRIEREIAPQIKTMYATSTWGLSSTHPLFPYPAPFGNPDSATYQGSPAAGAGLLPVTSDTCTGDPRCTLSSPAFVTWNTGAAPTSSSSGAVVSLVSCTWPSSTQAKCTGTYVALTTLQFTMTAVANNVGRAMRTLDASHITAEYQVFGFWIPVTSSTSAGFVAGGQGSANVNATATFPSFFGLGLNFRISMDLTTIADHPIITSTDATYGWFVRNQWNRLVYYVPSDGHTPDTLPSPTCGGLFPSCINASNVTPVDQRAILILAGRSINGSVRPSATLSDYLDFGNATGAYERETVSRASAPGKRPFNDRIVVVDTN